MTRLMTSHPRQVRMRAAAALLCSVLGLTLGVAGTASAQASAKHPADTAQRDPAQPLPEWDALPAQQREAMIQVLRERWNQQPQQRAQMLQHAERWRQMTPEQRQRAHRGAKRWQQMPPEQRERARARFDNGGKLSPEERATVRERLRAMTPEQREALRARLRAMSPEERERWLKGMRER